MLPFLAAIDTKPLALRGEIFVLTTDPDVRSVLRAVASYAKAYREFAKARPNRKVAERHFDGALVVLLNNLENPRLASDLGSLFKTKAQALKISENLREGGEDIKQFEKIMSDEFGIKRKNLEEIISQSRKTNAEIEAFEDTEELKSILSNCHEALKSRVNAARNMKRKQKKEVKKNMKLAFVSSTCCVGFLAGNTAFPAYMPYSYGVALFCFHAAARDLADR